jgi:hypothetical protein
MTQSNTGRLAIHRRSDEIAFLQDRLRTLAAASRFNRIGEQETEATSDSIPTQNNVYAKEQDLQFEVLARERELADELLHTRQIEPLGETLQRRLAMAERICRDLAPRRGSDDLSEACQVAEIERRALTEMLEHWWVWLRKS